MVENRRIAVGISTLSIIPDRAYFKEFLELHNPSPFPPSPSLLSSVVIKTKPFKTKTRRFTTKTWPLPAKLTQ